MKFGIAFNEASGPCLTRLDGKSLAVRNATVIAADSQGVHDLLRHG